MAKIKIPFTDKTVSVPIPIYDDMRNAKMITNRLKMVYNRKREQIIEKHNELRDSLELLGRVKASVYDGNIRAFVAHLHRVKDFDVSFQPTGPTWGSVGPEFAEFRTVDFKLIDGLKMLLAGGGAGAASGAIAFGAVGALAAASTGTAISSLAGVAATNATLAWLGGGALAAGGGGMAVGAAVLGGVIAIPALVVGGLIFNSKAKRMLNDSKEDRKQIGMFIKECDQALKNMDAIKKRSTQLKDVLTELDNLFIPMIDELGALIETYSYRNIFQKLLRAIKRTVTRLLSIINTKLPSWLTREPRIELGDLSGSDRAKFERIVKTALMIKHISDVEIISQGGLVTDASKQILLEANQFVIELSTR